MQRVLPFLILSIIVWGCTSDAEQQNEKTQMTKAECSTLQDTIQTLASKAAYCEKDSDCTTRFFPCGWNGKPLCQNQAFLHKNADISTLSKTIGHFMPCLNETIKQQCTPPQVKGKTVSIRCHSPLPLTCYRHRCIPK